jgi:nitroimidazol reductase NimA-like FMN-containing flavoprotein (pyridoxamine 5'-phosphate oxidase superfamily)
MNKPVQIPVVTRPKMDGYGVPRTSEGALPWEWALDRITGSHNYLLTTMRPGGSPHVMPVWGVWLDGAWYFSTSATSRKSRNLEQNANCVVCNENVEEAVILEGTAQRLKDDEIPKQAFVDYKAKYGWELDPKRGPVWKVTPRTVFAMPEQQFPQAVTKWVFD